MTNFFGRIGRSKCDCTIQLLVHSVEVDATAMTEFYLMFERGPQKDESTKFFIGPDAKKAEL